MISEGISPTRGLGEAVVVFSADVEIHPGKEAGRLFTPTGLFVVGRVSARPPFCSGFAPDFFVTRAPAIFPSNSLLNETKHGARKLLGRKIL